MTKKILLLALCSLLLALSFSAQAQQPAKVAKIGQIRARPGVSVGGQSEVIRRMFRELGYVEGKTIDFEYRYSEGKLDRIPTLTDELVRLKVDVLLTSSTAETLAAKNATKTIPIVFVSGADPVAAGLVDSLPRPGGNITGFTNISPVLAGKRLELLKEIIPKLSRVAVLWDPQDASGVQQWKESQLPARDLDLQLYSIEVSNAEIDSALKEAIKTGSKALAVTQSSTVNRNQKLIADLAKNYRLPTIGARGDFANSGGLMTYAADPVEPYRRAVWMVDKILKGTKPADIPVEQPTKFEFVINLNTAKALNLTIPQSVLFRADRVIK
ncbi:MAG TPA: ABC transporter substrate-binding protein [Candidatus Binatia bacterium]|jgi:putative ABC transport system substrate-binding protein|nr:ABC transporter substrate-binding protein [Candidatus Binatia bacterium]